jgi:dinuclear metal center YbgI/SA1388 family protein
MTLEELDRWLSSFLDLASFAGVDPCQNGLQVARSPGEVRKVAFAVDACMESFHRASAWGAQVLFVHHGILWDRVERLSGVSYDRVRFLVEKDLALFGVHLPMDVHPEVGNNIGIARHLGLESIEPFGAHRGVKIGYKGTLPAPIGIDELVRRLASRQGEPIRTLPFGPSEIRSVGIVSGGAPWEVVQAMAEGLDAYVTGESAHGIYHHCLEGRIHAIFSGHYHSETFGVRLLAERLARETGLETTYLDIPTGL